MLIIVKDCQSSEYQEQPISDPTTSSQWKIVSWGNSSISQCSQCNSYLSVMRRLRPECRTISAEHASGHFHQDITVRVNYLSRANPI